MSLSPLASIRLKPWTIWSLPGRLFSFLVLVEACAIAVLVTGIVVAPPVITASALWTGVALAAAGIIHTEVSLGIERMRHRVDDGPHIDLSSVWTFAAAALLPEALAAGVVVLIYAHLYVRALRPSGVPLHRVVFSTATMLLAVHAAAAVMRAVGGAEMFRTVPGLLALLAALAVYAVVNLVLVAFAILLRGGTTASQAFGHRDELLLELATLAMGAVVAAAIASSGPVYAALVLPPLLVLHRTVLVRQLQEAASMDGKTGLLNAAAWRLEANQRLRVARRDDSMIAVLLLDLDHFKLVNDRFGHLAGDQVLATIAAALRSEVRDDDLVGRFGGEEFVVLLSGAEGEELAAGAAIVAERIRGRVAALRPEISLQHGTVILDDITISIGGAIFPHDGVDLDQLLEVADAALYAAKRSGRNAVRMGLDTARPGA